MYRHCWGGGNKAGKGGQRNPVSHNTKIKWPRETSQKDVWTRTWRRLSCVNHVRNRHNAGGDIKFVGCNSPTIPCFTRCSWSSATRFAVCVVDVHSLMYVCTLVYVFTHVEVTGGYCLSSVAPHLKRQSFSLNSKLVHSPSLAGQCP